MAAIAAAVLCSPQRATHRIISSLHHHTPLSFSRPSLRTPPPLLSLPPPKGVKVSSLAVSLLDFYDVGVSYLGKKKEGSTLGESQTQQQLQPEQLLLRALLLGALVWVSGILFVVLTCGAASAATTAPAADSIRASSFGLKVAALLQRSGWPDEAVVFALATLPVLELRGAIPVGYWMHLDPVRLTILSVLGNMVPVPFIILYLKKFAAFIAGRNASASRMLDSLFERAKKKAGPVEEFQWLGLMLFVAVPFPGTGAWTGAFIAAILDMPFWSAVSSNFIGVVFAGLLVNLLVNLGLKYAVATGFILFFISTVMWSVLRNVKKSLRSN